MERYISGYDHVTSSWIVGEDSGRGTISNVLFYFENSQMAEDKAKELNGSC